MMKPSLQFFLIVMHVFATCTSAFTSPAPTFTSSASMMIRPNTQQTTQANTAHFQQIMHPTRSKQVAPIMMNRNPSSDVDGTGVRGPIILTITLLFLAWLFSIPPEFRRAHICSVERCVANRAACNDCQTIDEIKNGIIEYYKNGGGIQFDFSIDPVTIEKNKEFVKGIGL